MLLTIYSSRPDMYGNTYHAIRLTDFNKVLSSGKISADNVNTYDCHDMKIEVCNVQLPIRDFDRLVKDWEHLGCHWEEMKKHVIPAHIRRNQARRKARKTA